MTDAGLCGQIALTGLGPPGEKAAHIKSGCCEAMALWNAIDQSNAGRTGQLTILGEGNGDLMVYQGLPFQLNADSIEQWPSVY